MTFLRFGTFLCNCDRERHDLSLYARSPSLWAHLMADRDPLLNQEYSSSKQVSRGTQDGLYRWVAIEGHKIIQMGSYIEAHKMEGHKMEGHKMEDCTGG